MLSHGVSTKLVSQALLILATLAMLIGGVVLLLRDSSSGGVEIVLPMATVAATVEVEVYISGAVRRPGVYGVNDGDRLVQVIEAAGGSTEDADLTAVISPRASRTRTTGIFPGSARCCHPLRRSELVRPGRSTSTRPPLSSWRACLASGRSRRRQS